MAETKIGAVVERRDLSPILAIFRLNPQPGSSFPSYTAGQYIALRRDNCRLTRRILHPDGQVSYIQRMDEEGNPVRGPVTHSYSVASAPYETQQEGYLEFYIILETREDGISGRLTESLFQIEPGRDDHITYFAKIAGDFTLEKRAAGFDNVVMVASGTGLAPFVSMLKELHYRAETGRRSRVRYTLFHGNRGRRELGYHERLMEIERAGMIDFRYVPTVSRPGEEDLRSPELSRGRVNNLLRLVAGLPLKEEEMLEEVRKAGGDSAREEDLLRRAVRPILAPKIRRDELLDRMTPGEAVILTCGNPRLMADIEEIAGRLRVQFEKEVW